MNKTIFTAVAALADALALAQQPEPIACPARGRTATQQGQHATCLRALAACMEGRCYVVKSPNNLLGVQQ